MKSLLRTVLLLPSLFAATAAFANPALVTTDLHLRSGPGTGYRVIAAMPDGAIVDVAGCMRGYSWCRVDWNGYDGWAASRYLAQRSGRYEGRAYSSYGAEIGIPLIAGAVIGGALLGDHDGYYHHRRYYHHRHYRHWRHYRHRLHRQHRHLHRLHRRVRRERRHLRHLRRHERWIRHHHGHHHHH